MRAGAIACACACSALLACLGVDPDHAPRIDESCARTCGSGPGRAGGAVDEGDADPVMPSPNATDDDAAAAAVVTGSVDVNGLVRAIPDLAADPSTGSRPGMQLRVASETPGLTPIMTAVDGRFSVFGVSATTEPLVWLTFTDVGSKGARIATLFGAPPASLEGGVVVPLYPIESPADWAERLGAAGSGTATIVVHLTNGDGAPGSGQPASPLLGAAGPFYDDAKGGLALGDGTGPYGLVVFLQVPTSAPTVEIVVGSGKGSRAVPVRVAPFTISVAQVGV